MSASSESLSSASAQPFPSRRTLLLGGGKGILGVAGLGLAGTSPASSPHESGIREKTPTDARLSAGPFVTVADVDFVRDGKRWRFGGTNCHYLHASSHYMIDSVLNAAAAMGMEVMRCWAFNDGPTHPMAMQPSPYRYREAAFDSLDYVVFKAGELGMRLVLPLVNNWPDYGGMAQYVSWFRGLPDDTYANAINHDLFYTDANIRACYLAYATFLINRRNRYTDKRYGEDPTIMTWELANEPRNRSDTTGAMVKEWVADASHQIKRAAPNQLVSVGDEGFGLSTASGADYPYSAFEGNRWSDLTALPTVDYGTVHLYPQGWGRSTSQGVDPVAWGRRWVTDHAREARKLGKPVVLEEFGLHINPSEGVPASPGRVRGYDVWLDAAESSGYAGTQFWILTAMTDAGIPYEDYDGYRVLYPSDTAALITKHARRMRGPAS